MSAGESEGVDKDRRQADAEPGSLKRASERRGCDQPPGGTTPEGGA